MVQKKIICAFLYLSSLLLPAVSAVKYTSGSTEVDVTNTLVDANNSTEKCVEYLSNAPEKYSTACFTTLYTDGGTFMGCEVKLGDTYCDKCVACEDGEEEVGFMIDCDNFEPAVSTYQSSPSCIVLNDANIQEVLVDELFASNPFTFEMSSSVTDDSDMKNDTNTKDDSNSAATGFHTNMIVISASAIAALLYGL